MTEVFRIDIIYILWRSGVGVHQFAFLAFDTPRFRYQSGISIAVFGCSFSARLLYFTALLYGLVNPLLLFFLLNQSTPLCFKVLRNIFVIYFVFLKFISGISSLVLFVGQIREQSFKANEGQIFLR